MAARPNTLRTLEYGQNLAKNQSARVHDMLAMASSVLEDNKTLTPQDIAGYKACIATGKKHQVLFDKIAVMPLPMPAAVAPRKRGRPSKDDLNTLARARGEKVVATEEAPAAPKKRGRKPKQVVAVLAPAVVAEQPVAKRRGRPPKQAVGVTVAPVAAPVAVAAAVIAPAKRRGRPPKTAVATTVAAPVARKNAPIIQTLESDASDYDVGIKRGPGRPKGSKNKPKVVNGHNEESVAA